LQVENAVDTSALVAVIGSGGFSIRRSGGLKPEPSGVAGMSKLAGGGYGDNDTGFPPSRERQGERLSDRIRACLRIRNTA